MKVVLTIFVSLVFSGIFPAQNSKQTVPLQKDSSYYKDGMLYTTTIIRPKVSSGWTGHVRKILLGGTPIYSDVDGEITVGKDDITQVRHRGFTAFGINEIPDGAIITSIKLTCYTDTRSSSPSHTVFVKKLTVDPRVTRGDSLYNNIGNGAIISGIDWRPMKLLGFQSTNLTTAALLDLQNALSQGKYHWSIGFQEDQDDDGWGIFHGWSWGADRIPYCEVEYTVPSYLISVVPSALSFGEVVIGQLSDKTFTITNQSTNTNLMGNISISGTGFNFTSGVGSYNLGPGQSKTVNVRFCPAATGTYNGTVSVTHNASNQLSPVDIPLSGTGVATCKIYLSSQEIPFGSVQTGQYQERTFSIANGSGSTQYLVGNILELTGSFSITSGGGNFYLAPGDTKLVTLRFTPVSFGTIKDTLYIIHNAENAVLPLPLAMTGNGILTAIENLEFTGGTPKEYSLYQNYPNPFNPSTRIGFDIPEETVVDISIYDITGALVQNLLHNEVLKTGKYSVKFDAGDLPSGIYLYVYRSASLLSEKETFFTKKMLLLK